MDITLEAILPVVSIAYGVYNHLRSASRVEVKELRSRLERYEEYVQKQDGALALFLDSLDTLVDDLSSDVRHNFRMLIVAFRHGWRIRRAARDQLPLEKDEEAAGEKATKP